MIKRLLRKLFKIHSPSEEWTDIHYKYQEHDTKCDSCSRKDECVPYLIDVTRLVDTRTHFIKGIGYVCPIDEIVSKAAQELDPIVNECPCKVKGCSDELKMTCKKCDDYYNWIDRLKGETR